MTSNCQGGGAGEGGRALQALSPQLSGASRRVAVAFKDTQAKASLSVILDATGNQPTHILTYLVSKAVLSHHLGSRSIWGLPGGQAVTAKAQWKPGSDRDKTQQDVCSGF